MTRDETNDTQTRPGKSDEVPIREDGRDLGDVYVWIKYYGEREDVNQIADRIDTVIDELQDEAR